MEFLLGLVAAGVLLLLIRDFLPVYARKKADNLATRADIARIAAQLAQLERRDSLLEKRLEVHQRAFALWRRLVAALDSGEIGAVVRECQDFWETSGLYLSAEARDAFNRAYIAANAHRELTVGSVMGGSAKAVEENWQHIMKAGEAIVAGAELPALGEREAEIVAAGRK